MPSRRKTKNVFQDRIASSRSWEGVRRLELDAIASVATILMFLLPLLGAAGVNIPTAVSFGSTESVSVSAASAAFRFVILVILSLGCGWVLAIAIDRLPRLDRSVRTLAAVLCAFLWAYLLVAFCNWLFPARLASEYDLHLASWFTLFTGIASVVGLIGARLKLQASSPRAQSERALVLLIAPVAIFSFFILNLITI